MHRLSTVGPIRLQGLLLLWIWNGHPFPKLSSLLKPIQMVCDFPRGDLLATPSEALVTARYIHVVGVWFPQQTASPMRADGPEGLVEFMSPSTHVKWNSIC